MDRTVPIAAAGRIVASRPCRRARTTTDLAGSPARRLVEHGLLERRPDPKDRRANRLFLTRAGRQLVDDLDSLRDAIATDVLREIPDAAIETSLKALVDIKDRIKGLAERSDIAVK